MAGTLAVSAQHCATRPACAVHRARPQLVCLPLCSAAQYSVVQARSAASRLVSRPAQLLAAGGRRQAARTSRGSLACYAAIKALVFDCDGVIVESEDLHRQAYNATFKHFNVCCNNKPVEWTVDFYDMLQNKVGGGKPKMRWYFGENGWPSSDVLPGLPQTKEDQDKLVDALQDWKTNKYRDVIASGTVTARPGVVRIMDEARAAGVKLAVCSAATKRAVIDVLESLLGKERFQALDCFMAGDDVPEKKPDPSIYNIAAQRLGLQPEECLVVEDSAIGLQAALGAGMRCVITTTHSTRSQDFAGAAKVLEELGEGASAVSLTDLVAMVEQSMAKA